MRRLSAAEGMVPRFRAIQMFQISELHICRHGLFLGAISFWKNYGGLDSLRNTGGKWERGSGSKGKTEIRSFFHILHHREMENVTTVLFVEII